MTKRCFITLFFAHLLIFLSQQLNAQEPQYFGGEPAKKLDWTLFYLKAHYVDSTDADQLAELAILRMLKELDPFSRYQSKKQLDEQKKADEGIKNDGIGIRYYVVNDTATVTYIDQTGPSVVAGLLKGDKILSINGINTIGQNFAAIDTLILADKGSLITLKVKRHKIPNPFDIPITSVSLFAASLDAAYMITNKIGYVRFNRFTTKTLGEFKQAIKELKIKGAENLIVDLRNNSGGVVRGALSMVDEFLSTGKLIMSSEGNGLPRTGVTSEAGGVFETGRVAILTNGVTASASEIFTGALQEWDRALVIGEMTYGKGLIQQSYGLNDSSAVRLTIGRYFTPTGRMLQRPFDFDSSNDWIYQNIANAVHKNGFTAELDLPNEIKWTSKNGRTILKGQGGIIPDVYIPTFNEEKPMLKKLDDLGIIYRFCVYHADANRANYLYKYPNGNTFRLDKKVDNEIIANFYAFIMAKLEDKTYARSVYEKGISSHVLTRIKAWLAPQLWEIGSYYAVYNEQDPVIQRAIQCFQDGTFERLNIK